MVATRTQRIHGLACRAEAAYADSCFPHPPTPSAADAGAAAAAAAAAASIPARHLPAPHAGWFVFLSDLYAVADNWLAIPRTRDLATAQLIVDLILSSTRTPGDDYWLIRAAYARYAYPATQFVCSLLSLEFRIISQPAPHLPPRPYFPLTERVIPSSPRQTRPRTRLPDPELSSTQEEPGSARTAFLFPSLDPELRTSSSPSAATMRANAANSLRLRDTGAISAPRASDSDPSDTTTPRAEFASILLGLAEGRSDDLPAYLHALQSSPVPRPASYHPASGPGDHSPTQSASVPASGAARLPPAPTSLEEDQPGSDIFQLAHQLLDRNEVLLSMLRGLRSLEGTVPLHQPSPPVMSEGRTAAHSLARRSSRSRVSGPQSSSNSAETPEPIPSGSLSLASRRSLQMHSPPVDRSTPSSPLRDNAGNGSATANSRTSSLRLGTEQRRSWNSATSLRMSSTRNSASANQTPLQRNSLSRTPSWRSSLLAAASSDALWDSSPGLAPNSNRSGTATPSFEHSFLHSAHARARRSPIMHRHPHRSAHVYADANDPNGQWTLMGGALRHSTSNQNSPASIGQNGPDQHTSLLEESEPMRFSDSPVSSPLSSPRFPGSQVTTPSRANVIASPVPGQEQWQLEDPPIANTGSRPLGEPHFLASLDRLRRFTDRARQLLQEREPLIPSTTTNRTDEGRHRTRSRQRLTSVTDDGLQGSGLLRGERRFSLAPGGYTPSAPRRTAQARRHMIPTAGNHASGRERSDTTEENGNPVSSELQPLRDEVSATEARVTSLSAQLSDTRTMLQELRSQLEILAPAVAHARASFAATRHAYREYQEWRTLRNTFLNEEDNQRVRPHPVPADMLGDQHQDSDTSSQPGGPRPGGAPLAMLLAPSSTIPNRHPHPPTPVGSSPSTPRAADLSRVQDDLMNLGHAPSPALVTDAQHNSRKPLPHWLSKLRARYIRSPLPSRLSASRRGNSAPWIMTHAMLNRAADVLYPDGDSMSRSLLTWATLIDLLALHLILRAHLPDAALEYASLPLTVRNNTTVSPSSSSSLSFEVNDSIPSHHPKPLHLQPLDRLRHISLPRHTRNASPVAPTLSPSPPLPPSLSPSPSPSPSSPSGRSQPPNFWFKDAAACSFAILPSATHQIQFQVSPVVSSPIQRKGTNSHDSQSSQTPSPSASSEDEMSLTLYAQGVRQLAELVGHEVRDIIQRAQGTRTLPQSSYQTWDASSEFSAFADVLDGGIPWPSCQQTAEHSPAESNNHAHNDNKPGHGHAHCEAGAWCELNTFAKGHDELPWGGITPSQLYRIPDALVAARTLHMITYLQAQLNFSLDPPGTDWGTMPLPDLPTSGGIEAPLLSLTSIRLTRPPSRSLLQEREHYQVRSALPSDLPRGTFPPDTLAASLDRLEGRSSSPSLRTSSSRMRRALPPRLALSMDEDDSYLFTPTDGSPTQQGISVSHGSELGPGVDREANCKAESQDTRHCDPIDAIVGVFCAPRDAVTPEYIERIEAWTQRSYTLIMDSEQQQHQCQERPEREEDQGLRNLIGENTRRDQSASFSRPLPEVDEHEDVNVTPPLRNISLLPEILTTEPTPPRTGQKYSKSQTTAVRSESTAPQVRPWALYTFRDGLTVARMHKPWNGEQGHTSNLKAGTVCGPDPAHGRTGTATRVEQDESTESFGLHSRNMIQQQIQERNKTRRQLLAARMTARAAARTKAEDPGQRQPSQCASVQVGNKSPISGSETADAVDPTVTSPSADTSSVTPVALPGQSANTAADASLGSRCGQSHGPETTVSRPGQAGSILTLVVMGRDAAYLMEHLTIQAQGFIGYASVPTRRMVQPDS